MKALRRVRLRWALFVYNQFILRLSEDIREDAETDLRREADRLGEVLLSCRNRRLKLL